MTVKPRILVVDDEETLCEVLRFNLEESGYAVDVAYSAEEALSLDLSVYALILLDIMMGEISGVQMASILKSQKSSVASIPIIFCTAKDAEDEMIAGLELGADDYITKPYSIANVLARVRAILRRTAITTLENSVSSSSTAQPISYKGLVIHPMQKECIVDGVEVRMPRKEFEILSLFLRYPNRIFSRAEILSAIWTDEVIVLDRVIDVNITRLRAKIGSYAKNIVTRAGYGYGFMD